MSGYDYSAELANELLEAADQKIEELQAEIERLHGPRLEPKHVEALDACVKACEAWGWTIAVPGRAALAELGEE